MNDYWTKSLGYNSVGYCCKNAAALQQEQHIEVVVKKHLWVEMWGAGASEAGGGDMEHFPLEYDGSPWFMACRLGPAL